MLEIVFSESACGSMKCTRGFSCDDVHGFQLALSVGDIAGDILGPARRAVLCELCSFPLSVPGIAEQIDRWLEDAAHSLQAVLARSAAGEAARIWYSDQPDEMCGFHWILAQLDGLEECGPVHMVKLPQYEQRCDGTVVERMGWNETAPEEWHKFSPLEEPVSPNLRRACAARWRELRGENAPLRAVLNGCLTSVPEDIYDSFIRRELAQAGDEFLEARVIGKILTRYQLRVSDGLLARRIERMIAAGELEAVTQAAEGNPLYSRILRKREQHGGGDCPGSTC